jgi:hypothetical protein
MRLSPGFVYSLSNIKIRVIYYPEFIRHPLTLKQMHS